MEQTFNKIQNFVQNVEIKYKEIIFAFSFFDRQMYFNTFVAVIVVCGAIDTIKKMERKEFEKPGENFEIILLKLQPTFVAVLFFISVLKYYNFL